MNAIHNVTYGMPRTMPRPDRVARAEQLLAKLGVSHLAHRRPRTYSGGEAQRVALARAIARSPKLVLLDEPFSALDRDLKRQLIELVRGLVSELGVPIVHVTHSVAEARVLGDQIIRIEKGKIVATGKPADVLANVTSLDD
jgi:ABC-type molybdate transport system ATPase subunit